MAQLILLVVAAAWLAVLIPPMLRSRVENRPNSSVTDFRRQLTKLQNTATPQRGAVRAMGRPLAQSPLTRPVAGGRPGQPQLRSGVTRHVTASERAAMANAPTMPDVVDDVPRFRSHGDPTGGRGRLAPRDARQRDPRPRETGPRDEFVRDDDTGGMRRHGAPRQVRDERDHREPMGYGDTRQRQRPSEAPQRAASGHRSHGDPTGGRRRPSNATGEIRTPAKQRRLNVMFVLVVTTVCTLILAASTGSQVMYYGFALSFLSLFGYVWMLAQARQREVTGSYDGWMDSY